jgi:hypothetical protein
MKALGRPARPSAAASAHVQPDRDAIGVAEQLHADVVAAPVVAGARDDPERPVGQAQHRRGGVHLAMACEPLVVQHRAVGVDLDDLLAGDPAEHVEVVDVQVPEDAAGGGDVALVGRGRVVGRQAGAVPPAERSGDAQAPRFQVAGVEAPLEADLQGDAGPGDVLDDRVGVSRSSAIGFSQNVASPASAPRRISSAWAEVAAAITSAWTPPSTSACGEGAAPAPSSSAARAARSVSRLVSRSVIVSRSTAGDAASTRTWKAPMRPAPISPTCISPPLIVTSGSPARRRSRPAPASGW